MFTAWMKKMFTQNFEMKKMFTQNKCLLPEWRKCLLKTLKWRKCLLKTLKWRKCLLITNFYSLNCLAGLLAGEVTDNLPSSKRALLPHFLQHDVRNKIFMIYHTHFLQHDVRNKVFMIYQTYLIFFKFAPHRSDAVPSLKKDCCLSNNVRDYHFVSQVLSGCLPCSWKYNNRNDQMIRYFQQYSGSDIYHSGEDHSGLNRRQGGHGFCWWGFRHSRLHKTGEGDEVCFIRIL